MIPGVRTTGPTRYALTSAVLVFAIGAVLLVLHFADLLGQYRTYDYALALWHQKWNAPASLPVHGLKETGLSRTADAGNTTSVAGDKVIVMAKVADENTDWVRDYLPDWQRAVYTVNPNTSTPASTLVTPANKGHESMAYLTYIVENYSSLPSTIAFLHSHRRGFLKAWHTDTPLHDNVYAMRNLQLGWVQENGYVNLRCKWNPGCLEAHRRGQNMKHITAEVWETIFNNTSTPPVLREEYGADALLENEEGGKGGIAAAAAGEEDDYVAGSMGGLITQSDGTPGFLMPARVGVACCAQFVVSRAQVQKRPLSDYERFRQWVMETELDDAKSGRVMEYLWHIIFGMDVVYCPDEKTCYCKVYGICD